MASSPPPTTTKTTGSTVSADAPSATDTRSDAPAAPVPIAAEPNDPVASLHAAFPSIDKTIVSEVLAAHGGNLDAASVALLDISSGGAAGGEAGGQETAAVARNAQLASDEAYARELMAQMEREHQAAYGRPLNSPPDNSRRHEEPDYSQLNYVPRQRNRFGQAVGQPGQSTHAQSSGAESTGRRDELDQLTEQFEKFADTGKKTINSLFSKVKDKAAQVQQQRAEQAQYRAMHPEEYANNYQTGSSGQPSRGPGGFPTSIAGFQIPTLNDVKNLAQSVPAPWQQRAQSPEQGSRPEEGSWSTGAGQRTNLFNRPSNERRAVGSPSGAGRESAIKDYSLSPSSSPAPPPKSEAQSISARSNSATPLSGPALSSSPATSASAAHLSTSPPARSGTGMSSSPAKVPMLPKQTISLLDGKDAAKRSTSPEAPAVGGGAARKDTRADDSDDSDVEYVRNPFDEDD